MHRSLFTVTVSVTWVTLFFFASSAWSASTYTGGAVSGGGAIKGKITLSDASKQDETLTISKDQSYCGGTISAEKYLISGNNLINAVVKIDGIASGKPFETQSEYLMTNDKCRFVPHVMIAPKGGLMKVRNDDPLLHNSHFYLVQANSKKKNVINLALPKKGLEIGKKKILRKPGLLSLQCDAHDFMQAWIWVIENPYASVTGEDGTFSLTDVHGGRQGGGRQDRHRRRELLRICP